VVIWWGGRGGQHFAGLCLCTGKVELEKASNCKQWQARGSTEECVWAGPAVGDDLDGGGMHTPFFSSQDGHVSCNKTGGHASSGMGAEAEHSLVKSAQIFGCVFVV